MKQPLSLLVLVAALITCTNEEIPKGVPSCVKRKIREIARHDAWNPPAIIYSLQFEGQTAYYFPPRCCDIPSTLYDESCNIICSPDGGHTGQGDGQCPDFSSTYTDPILIWEDDR